MRFLFNRYRLTTTLEINAGEVIIDPEILRRRCLKRYQRMIDQGGLDGFVDFAEDIFIQFHQQGPSERQRHLLAVGIPSWKHVRVKKRHLGDFFRGIATQVEINTQAGSLDPRLGLALLAKVAQTTGLPLGHLNEMHVFESLQNLDTLEPDHNGIVAFPVYLQKASKELKSFEFGALVRLRDGRLALGLSHPETLVDRKQVQVVATALQAALMVPDLALSLVEVDAMLLRWQMIWRQLPQWSRLRQDFFGGVWPLEDLNLASAHSEPKRAFSLPLIISDDAMIAKVKAPLECQGCRGPAIPTILELQGAIRANHVKRVDSNAVAQLLADIMEGKKILLVG